jgi:5-methylcytosine-specific restriction endonuclease McrA
MRALTGAAKICSKNENETVLQTHHLTYKNVGNENVYEDLIMLCKSCHANEHGKEE